MCKALLVIAVADFALSSYVSFDFVFGAFPGRPFSFSVVFVPISSLMVSGIGVMIRRAWTTWRLFTKILLWCF